MNPRDGLSVACDTGMHEWCGVHACECGCHAQKPQAPRTREKTPSRTSTIRRAPIGRQRRSYGLDQKGG